MADEYTIASAVQHLLDNHDMEEDEQEMLDDVTTVDMPVPIEDGAGTVSVRVGFGDGELYDIIVKHV